MGSLLGSLRRGFVALSLCGVLGASLPSYAGKDPFVDALEKRLRFIFKDDKLGAEHLGIEVFSLSRQETLFGLNAQAPLMPASTVKLLTGHVALKKLGPDFTYKTEAFFEKPPKGGVLDGNLYLRGNGDPSLVTERLFLLAGDLARTGIREIRGNIVVDDWAFDQVLHDSRRIPTDTDRPYNAPVGALSFNYNSTTVYFRPGDKEGDPAQVFVEPDTGYVKIVNQAKTSKAGSAYKIDAVRSDGGDKGDTIRVRGSIPAGMAEQRRHFNIVSPSIYSGYALKMMLEMRGVKIAPTSKIVHQPVPPTARKIAEMSSLPLREIVTLMNKYSNNFIADSIIKTLGKEIKGSPGTMDKGLEVLNEEALRLGLNSKGMTLVSGSGLTRINRMSARQFIQLINAAYLDFEVLPELLSSLPIAGRDGTLRTRMNGTQAFGRLRGKTGSINGVSAIAGVVQSRGGELLAYSVMMNDSSKNNLRLRDWQDNFGQALAEFNRRSPMTEQPREVTPTLGGQ
jgi:serine-type D-Ala-D-Ala carboxypeptidase/endopeptidase (penicillin-binding protein 4)